MTVTEEGKCQLLVLNSMLDNSGWGTLSFPMKIIVPDSLGSTVLIYQRPLVPVIINICHYLLIWGTWNAWGLNSYLWYLRTCLLFMSHHFILVQSTNHWFKLADHWPMTHKTKFSEFRNFLGGQTGHMCWNLCFHGLLQEEV